MEACLLLLKVRGSWDIILDMHMKARQIIKREKLSFSASFPASSILFPYAILLQYKFDLFARLTHFLHRLVQPGA
jgi:hypothetical protein